MEEDFDNGNSAPILRKRKRKMKNSTFLWRAKKQLKEGRCGHLDPETYEYFLRIGERVRYITREPEDDRRDFCSNVLQEAMGKEWEIASHPMSARILEQVIPNSNWADGATVRECLASRLTWDHLGCPAHLLETIVRDAGRRVKENEPEKAECVKFLEDRAKLFLNNLEHQIWESNFNHLTRCCLIVCSETDVEDLHEIVTQTALYVMSWGQLNDHFNSPLISGFVQTLLSATSNCCPLTCDKLQKHLLKKAFSIKNTSLAEKEDKSVVETASEIAELFNNEPLTRLMEAALAASSEKIYLKLYKKFFKNSIKVLAVKNSTHFAIVSLVGSCQDKFIFETIYDQLMDILDDLFGNGFTNIVKSICEKCIDLSTKQGDFIQQMKIWFGCNKKEDRFVPCLLRLKKLDHIDLSEDKITIDGSIILQSIFKFNKPIKVVESFLALDVSELLAIAEDPKGSWLFNSFLSSTTVGEKSRSRLVSKFRNYFLKLATTKFGSRVYEEIWKAAKFKERQLMIAELDRTLLGSQSGRFLVKKIQLELYLTDKKTWTARHSNYKDFAPYSKNDEIKQELS